MNWKIYPIAALVCAVLLTAPMVRAAAPTPVAHAQTLMSQDDLKGALQVLDGYLKKAPQDANARFTRGLVLTRLGRTDDALKTFSALTKDYPQLPEPYNNLAVLYAKKGEYDKAREALKAALATHPSYATASENLGDVYAAMAAQAYNHALKIDKNNKQVRYKLALIKRLNTNSQTASTSASTPVAETPVAAATPPQGAAEPAGTAVASAAPPPTASNDQGGDAVAAAVAAWAAAWSRQDVGAYVDHYAANFADDGMSHAAWEKQRRERLTAPKHISVELSDLKVLMQGADKAQASFNQHYVSDTYHDKVHKVLELRDIGGQWKIVQEAVR